jgi:hypothetical protein
VTILAKFRTVNNAETDLTVVFLGISGKAMGDRCSKTPDTMR